MQAVFESIPQCSLQLVFLIRTNGEYDGNGYWHLIAVGLSVLSMMNAILQQDNQYMMHSKYDKYRQLCPPTSEFLKHGIFRLSEVLNRISVLSLLWAICG